MFVFQCSYTGELVKLFFFFREELVKLVTKELVKISILFNIVKVKIKITITHKKIY